MIGLKDILKYQPHRFHESLMSSYPQIPHPPVHAACQEDFQSSSDFASPSAIGISSNSESYTSLGSVRCPLGQPGDCFSSSDSTPPCSYLVNHLPMVFLLTPRWSATAIRVLYCWLLSNTSMLSRSFLSESLVSYSICFSSSRLSWMIGILFLKVHIV